MFTLCDLTDFLSVGSSSDRFLLCHLSLNLSIAFTVRRCIRIRLFQILSKILLIEIRKWLNLRLMDYFLRLKQLSLHVFSSQTRHILWLIQKVYWSYILSNQLRRLINTTFALVVALRQNERQLADIGNLQILGCKVLCLRVGDLILRKEVIRTAFKLHVLLLFSRVLRW